MMRISGPTNDMLVGQAGWHGASQTMIDGLRASGIPARGVDEADPSYTSLGFHHPGCMLGPKACRPVSPQTLSNLGIVAPACTAGSPKRAAAAAVMRDDPDALEPWWPSLNAPERTAMLCCAAAVGGTAVARFCIARLASQLDDHDGGFACNTPMHYAALAGQAGVAQLLLKGGANPTPENPVNTEPMHDAARSGSVEVLASLHECGVDLTRSNAYGDTLLHRVAGFGTDQACDRYVAVVDFVLAQRPANLGTALINLSNRKGHTALDMATARGQNGLATALRNRGASHSAAWDNLPDAERTWERLSHRDEWANECATLAAPDMAA